METKTKTPEPEPPFDKPGWFPLYDILVWDPYKAVWRINRRMYGRVGDSWKKNDA